ncbi:MAG: hypothetical protein SLagBPW_26610 [Shewanella algae]
MRGFQTYYLSTVFYIYMTLMILSVMLQRNNTQDYLKISGAFVKTSIILREKPALRCSPGAVRVTL